MVLQNFQGNLDKDENENNAHIIINNLNNFEKINYSLALIKGTVKTNFDSLERKIQCRIQNETSEIISSSEWDVRGGEFKTLVELKLGKNYLSFLYCDKTLDITVEYEPRKTNFKVTPVYIICDNHDGSFQCPQEFDCSVETACSKIAIGSKLIQTLIAEKLYEAGVGRKTFQLENEVNPQNPGCIVFKSNLNVNKARKMNELELWSHFGRELIMSDIGSNDRKFLAFISCTRYKGVDFERKLNYDEIKAITEAHAALGGGGLALFGTGCLYTWPTNVNEIIPKFLDETLVNNKRFMDDSCYRGTFGGCFATTLGSVCHELGHTFDLGHTKDGIMGRGFDNIDRVFTVGDRKRRQTKDTMNNFNGKPVQHSTVSFERNISVTMNVAEPLRVLGPRSKTTLGNYCHRKLNKRAPNVTPVTRPSSLYSSLMSSSLTESKTDLFKPSSDSTYFTKNCAVFLAHHRWFNNEYGRERETITRYLKFDKNKMLILSTAGIRIVEVREESTGLVIDSYEFMDVPEKRFLVPFTISPKCKTLLIVVEDDLGNVLKQIFSY